MFLDEKQIFLSFKKKKKKLINSLGKKKQYFDFSFLKKNRPPIEDKKMRVILTIHKQKQSAETSRDDF